MSKISELFGHSINANAVDWPKVVREQACPFIGKRCYKVRKSDPSVSIGTCTVMYGKDPEPVLICPTRLIDRKQIFTDCFHLLTMHEPGNELHIVSEVAVPGGSVDFFLVSARDGKVKDFVGIELQTMDTTGTVWPERQRLLKELAIPRADDAEESSKTFGMNWKMTAKTILVQMHHKVQTFEHLNKKLVLIVQDKLLAYMSREFKFDHLNSPAILGDSMHLHAYSMRVDPVSGENVLSMASRLSTDADGIAVCMGLQADARIEMAQIVVSLQAKISSATRFNPV
ncbi:NotI family restriction endonuclease [Stenotrophomonas maltophilia]|uniref:NotI family restriction endonuclease n=1 Tax=Stenotrophomonas maltophilia TaxID=40324 RepID=UPI000DA8B25F|nr:NotI family restriction endonuclease [Stenotrophomonas maltophilia]MBH1878786.1 hypothetical protein [Stenotrophomonas maltophilia]MDT3449263.1 NotI family restriction endonuclease [Stenotrophomonas maltophilia]PZS69488.1 hypothetical protein A7X68_06730 [Stenotrophomonas maltophilia]